MRKHTIKPEIVNDIFLAALLLLGIDYGYKFYLSFQQQASSCLIISILPQGISQFYKYFIELILLVFVGIHLSNILQVKLKPSSFFIPKNPFHAFIYASILPVCSCSVVPFIPAIKERSGYATVISFILSAAILNPFTILLSFSLIGWEYGILRIAASLLLSITSGYILALIFKKLPAKTNALTELCSTSCTKASGIHNATVETFIKLLPYTAIAAVVSFVVDIGGFGSDIEQYIGAHSLWAILILVLISAPLYFCNGSEILFLSSLYTTIAMPLGNAIAFTLGATALCISSAVLLAKVLGELQALTLVAVVIIEIVLISGGIMLIA